MNRPRGWTIFLCCVAALGFTVPGHAGAGGQWPPVTDVPTHIHVLGRSASIDLLTDEVAVAERFYAEVFGWTFERHGEGKQVYALARAGGQRVGGVAYVAQAKAANRAGRWIGMVSVPDVDAAASYVAKAGGKVLLEPRDLPGRGKASLVRDPEGAPFGLIRSLYGDPVDELGDDNTWLWGELWAQDPAAMARFYQGLGVFTPRIESRAEEPTEYVLMAEGYPRAGIIRSPRESIPAVWLPYLRVGNLARTLERVVQAGGRVALPPDPKIRGGRVAIFIDPGGAPVGVAEGAEPREGRP